MSLDKYNYRDLIRFSQKLLVHSGLPEDRAKLVSEMLVEADLMGHTTHGLQLLTPYASELVKGDMTTDGDPEIIHDSGGAISWDGRYLPGPWLVRKAMDEAVNRIKTTPVVTVTLRNSHHIGCLAVYPEIVTRRGLIMILACSDPRNKTVAPYGGLTGVYSPNPVAAGFPTEKDPIIFDISMSTTTNGLVMRKEKEGKKLDQPWLLNNDGKPTDDPGSFFEKPPATILPLGSSDLGYKGFALGILVEVLTNALGGLGRSDMPNRWGASVFMQIIDPEAFGGLAHFKKEMQFFAQRSLASEPVNKSRPVRLPGQRALKLKRDQIENGVELHPAVWKSLKELSDKYAISLPAPLQE